MYILYPFLVVINLLGIVASYLFAPLLVLCVSNQDGWCLNGTVYKNSPRLWKIFSWFQTPDNSIDGDAGWQATHKQGWWSRLFWLDRNPFCGFAVFRFDGSTGMSYTGDLDCSPTKLGSIFVKGHGLFQYVLYKKLGSKVLYLNFGWNIKALVEPGYITPDEWHDNTAFIKDYQATFSFSPRLI